MKAKWLSVVMLPALLAGSGCARPQYGENYFIERQDNPVVRGFRYAGNEQNPIDNLWIRLDQAVPFQFRFPDGEWVDSRKITRQTLSEHGIRVYQDGTLTQAVWHPDLPLWASVVGRHQYFSFDIEPDGKVSSLTLGACGSAFKEIFRTARGTHTIGFPMTVKEFELIFGPTSRVDRLALMTGFSCF